jgi:hypothetical protein
MSRTISQRALAIALSGIALSAIPGFACAQQTISQPMTQINFSANSRNGFAVGPAKWGAPGCPGATYVLVPDQTTNQGNKLLWAMVVAAKHAGSKVTFLGACAAWDLDYFVADYVIVN